MMAARKRFHEELAELEADILRMGELAERAVRRSVEALVERDADLAGAVIAEDDAVDDLYLSVDRRSLQTLALQTPVAGDLRLISAIIHINSHLERIADMAVNISKTWLSVRDLPGSPKIVSQLQEMGDMVCPMIRTSMEAFARRDPELCRRLPAMDDPVDRLNIGMYEHVSELAGDPALLDWGLRMNMIARQLERVGDNAVDVAEQADFLVTGEFHEFTDASHQVQSRD